MSDKTFTPALQAAIRLSDTQPGPYYVQLQRQLQALIDSGALGEGSYLPSERDLAEALKVSRTTVKRAYDALREADVIASGAGRGGTIVKRAPRVSPEMSRLKGFTEEMRELGMEPSTRLLTLEVVQDRTIASIFGSSSTTSFRSMTTLGSTAIRKSSLSHDHITIHSKNNCHNHQKNGKQPIKCTFLHCYSEY